MPASDKIQRLVEVFERNLPAYKNSGYKEAQLRSEFIEPFFEELGWDVRNKQGWAEAYKDVITEDAIKVGGYTKAPDYCFRIGGTRKFFLEAKKPSVDIRGDVSPAYQLRRYAWSADLPLSILTDFEEFAVYNCRVRPQLKDKPGQDRVMFIPYREYAERWDEIAAVFSRKAVLEGLFDKYAESVVGRRTTQEVDDEFLKEIEGWRDLLARNIALRNPSLSIRELNYAVQKTIDRIIFLRICEDRGAERYGQLQALLNGPRIYRRLTEIFQQADEKYNSGLFHFREEKGMVSPPDTLTAALTIDDQVLKEILKNLYYPDSPYEFSVLGSEILGNIYEQFLGKVIRLTAGHHAVVEEKPEVRKAGGVYYTPTYIVDYIVKNTVGKLCEGKTPKQIEKLKILDPACGSGSFLIGAYTYLLNYHRDWYVKHLLPERGFEGAIAKAALRKLVPGEKPEMPVYQGRGGQWYLSTREKKRILLNNIFGVDIDSQAVEVTKLSLLLKVLENENQDTLDRQMKLWRERALPDLGNNIKCGNSLIGPDIFEAGSLRAERSNPISFTPEDRERINAFDWTAEFQEIMKSGGFDVVIGNPPWGQKDIDSDIFVKNYIRSHYASAKGIYDLFRPFVEGAIRLTTAHGYWGMVLPDIVLLKNYPETRLFILDHVSLTRIDWWGMVFHGAAIDAVTLIGEKDYAAAGHKVHVVVRDEDAHIEHDLLQKSFRSNPRYTFNLYLTKELNAMLTLLQDKPTLGELFEIHEGIHSGNIRNELFIEAKVDESCRELIFGRDEIQPYLLQWKGKYVRLNAVPEKRTKERYANIGRREWYEQDKILIRRTGDYILAAVDRARRYASNNFFLLIPKSEISPCLEAVVAILNSKYMTWFFRTIEPRKGRMFAEVKIKDLLTFPLPCSDARKVEYNKLCELSKHRSILAQELLKCKTPECLVSFRRQVDYLDAEIEMVVLKALDVDNLQIQVNSIAKREGDENGK